jgi:hypothetical protein
MSSTGYQGRGSFLEFETLDSSPGSFVRVAQLQKFSFGGLKVATDKITNLDSPDAFEEIIATIIDPGDVSFDGILNPETTDQADMLTLLQNRTKTGWKIVLTDGTYYTFEAYLTEFVPANVDYSKAITFSGKLTITGAVSVTPMA